MAQEENKGECGDRGGNGRDGGVCIGGGRTLLTWFLSHVLVYPILPGHQADLTGNTGDGEEVGAELRMREPAPRRL